mgnify:CR=1 FL=1
MNSNRYLKLRWFVTGIAASLVGAFLLNGMGLRSQEGGQTTKVKEQPVAAGVAGVRSVAHDIQVRPMPAPEPATVAVAETAGQ